MKKGLVLLTACSLVLAVSSNLAVAKEQKHEFNPKHKKECVCREKDTKSWEAKKAEMEQKRAQDETRLKLTNKQKTQAKALRDKSNTEFKAVMEELKVKHEELNKIEAKKFDWVKKADRQAKVKLNEDIQALHEKAKLVKQTEQQDFEKILTSAQKKEFEAIRAERKAEIEAKMEAKKAEQKCFKHKMMKKDCNCKKECKKGPKAPEVGTGK